MRAFVAAVLLAAVLAAGAIGAGLVSSPVTRATSAPPAEVVGAAASGEIYDGPAAKSDEAVARGLPLRESYEERCGGLPEPPEMGLMGTYDDARYIDQRRRDDTRQFVFARLIYNGRIPAYIKNWYTDYPKADCQLILGIQRLTNLDLADHSRAVAITDPELFRYPFVYTSEPGQMLLTDADAAIMREYLERGGFWVFDDFWGSFEWNNMEAQIRKVLPDARIEPLPADHLIFDIFFPIREIVQVPSLAYVFNGGIVHEQDGFEANHRGVWTSDGRLVAVINHNTDLGDAYEWADEPQYPHVFSNFAYRMAINTIIYALTH